MAQYGGYVYRSISTYSTVRNEPRGPVVKPFSPFVPKNDSKPDGYVTKKTIVPVTSRPYGDDYNSHSSPSRGDYDDQGHPQTSPFRGSPRKVDHEFPQPTKVHNHEASRPQRASTDWPRHAPQPTPYSAADYGSNKEGHNPIGGTVRNENHDGYNRPTGYGDYGRNKEGRKPIGGVINNHDGYNGPNGYGDYGSNNKGRKPIGSAIDDYDDYNGTNGYGDYGGNKEGHKPKGSPIRNVGSYDGTNGYGDYGSNKEGHKPNGYGDYGSNNKGRKPIGSAIRNDNYDGPNGYGSNKDGTRKPIGGAIRNDKPRDGYNYNGTNGYGDREERKPIGSPIRNNDNYDGPNGYGGYGGDYNNREGYKQPASPPIKGGNYDGYNNGNSKEQRRPFGSTNYGDDYGGNYNNGPKISSAWTAAPRKGTQLSEPTHDIEKALELLRMEAAKHEHSNSNNYDRPNPSANGGSRLGDLTSKFDKGMDVANEAERLKNIVTGGSPKYSSSVPVEPATPTKDNYGGDAATRPLPGVTVIDGRGADYRDGARRYGHPSVMDSVEAEKRFKGMRLW